MSIKNIDTGQTFTKCENCDRPPIFLYWEAPKCSRHWLDSFVLDPATFPHLKESVRKAKRLIKQENIRRS